MSRLVYPRGQDVVTVAGVIRTQTRQQLEVAAAAKGRPLSRIIADALELYVASRVKGFTPLLDDDVLPEDVLAGGHNQPRLVEIEEKMPAA